MKIEYNILILEKSAFLPSIYNEMLGSSYNLKFSIDSTSLIEQLNYFCNRNSIIIIDIDSNIEENISIIKQIKVDYSEIPIFIVVPQIQYSIFLIELYKHGIEDCLAKNNDLQFILPIKIENLFNKLKLFQKSFFNGKSDIGNINHEENLIKKLEYHTRLLEGISTALNFLAITDDYDLAMAQVLEKIGKSSESSWVYICESAHKLQDRVNSFTIDYFWLSSNAKAHSDETKLLREYELPLPTWIDSLQSNKIIYIDKNIVNTDIHLSFLKDKLDTLLLIPLVVSKKFWGFMEFGNIGKYSNDFESEISLLKAFAAGVSGAISRKINTEKLYKALKIAEKANKTKSEFLANMSHEIRTPLNAIKGFTDYIMELEKNPQMLDYLNVIRVNTLSLMDIINDILDFSKIESGHLKIELIPLNLKDLMTDLEKTFSVQANKKNLQLRLKLDSNLPLFIIGDPLRLRQILTNLIGNAIKFTENGYVDCNVYIDNNCQESIIKFSVKDSGIGIDKADQIKLFRKFTQSDSSTSRRFGGTGLGLAISKNLVNLMGGRITVNSELGVGSEFIFYIPLIKSDNTISSNNKNIYKVELPKTEFNKIHILLVEDNIYSQRLAVLFLTRFGFIVETAVNGEDALNLLSEKDYDIVLMDLQLPKLDGFEACSIIRKNESPLYKIRNSKIPIIALSADALLETVEKAKSIGIDDFVSKPFDFNELVMKISNNLFLTNKNNNSFTKEKPKMHNINNERSTLLNLDYLNDLSGNDQEFVNSLLKTFLEHNNQLLYNLIDAAKNNQWNNVSKIAHKMKSGYASIGLSELFENLTEIEKKSCSPNQIEYLIDLVNKVELESNQVFIEIKNLLDG